MGGGWCFALNKGSCQEIKLHTPFKPFFGSSQNWSFGGTNALLIWWSLTFMVREQVLSSESKA